MLRIAICDDESRDIDLLMEKLNKFANELGILFSIDTFSSGIELLNSDSQLEEFYDIIYLDIRMPKKDGMEVAKELRDIGFENEIIFNTKSRPEVFIGYDVDAFHYIVKDETPVEKQKEIFINAYKEVQKKTEKYITVSCAGESITIPLNRVSHFQVESKICQVHYDKNKSFEFYTSLKKLQNTLLDKGFVRINSNSLVNMAYIRKWTKTEVILKDGKQFEIGRTYKKNATILLDKYFKSREVFRI
ncbi:MAG: LytTR family DNA-binding domain-containing protein [Lachnospiraceae bacterium]|jgi:DNA-binding LytR/AlgR family response regulator|nr:LytTR family DNA-binding domain-containing protein [Lachnospiraceae bacterium]